MNREERAALWRTRKAQLDAVTAEVAEEYGLPVGELWTRSRVAPMPEARREVMARMWERGLSLSEIARLTDRDPSTVCTAVRKAMGDTYADLTAGPGKVREVGSDERRRHNAA